MSVTDQFTVDYTAVPTDDELRRLTESRPGAVDRLTPGAKRAGRRVTRSVSRSLRRGWACVRGCLGSLAAAGTATAGVFIGWGLVPGLFATAVALLAGEKLIAADARDRGGR